LWFFDFLFLVWCSLVSSVVVSGLTQVLQFPILLYFFFVARKKEIERNGVVVVVAVAGGGPVEEGEEKTRGSVDEKRSF